MSDVLNVIDGVEVTHEMVNTYAKRFGIDPMANMPGIIGSIGMWIRGKGTLDAYITDSVETREQFAAVRKAYFVALGGDAETPYSNVNFQAVEPVAAAEAPAAVEPAPAVSEAPVEPQA